MWRTCRSTGDHCDDDGHDDDDDDDGGGDGENLQQVSTIQIVKIMIR